MGMLTLALAAASCFVQNVYTLPTLHIDNDTKSDDRGTFQEPPARVRTKFRYWVPDASVDIQAVEEDIAAIGRIGGGGVELLPYYNYGDITPGIIPTDWTQYGWGTQAWSRKTAGCKATKDNNLVIDLALGPNQGAGVPAPVNSEGLQWDLQPFNVSVASGESFDDILPGWGTGELVAAVAGLVTAENNGTTGITYTLATHSLEDISAEVGPDGRLFHKFAGNKSAQHGVIFAYYLVHTQYREQRSPLDVVSGNDLHQSPVTSFVQNGSWVVDHFSAKGPAQVKQFWDQFLLNGSDTVQDLAQVGRYFWEDSHEFPSNILWTANAPEAFEKQHGYSIAKYLPILMHDNGGGIIVGVQPPNPPDYITDEVDGGAKYVADFRRTMTDLNKEYLVELTSFAHELGMESNTQVGFNLPIDMLSNIPYVDVPETETLGFDPELDTYRQFVGPAGVAGKRIVSLEAGAVFNAAYQQSVPEQLYYLKRSVIGGVHSFKLHGMSFSGNYANTTWPGFTPFSYVVSELHNQRQPGWDYYKDWMDFTARVQYAMQTGVTKVDLAFWLKVNSSAGLTSSYQDADLTQAGYTYEYLSPNNFDIPNAYVKDGVLAPGQQAFKALIVRENGTMTFSGVETMRTGLMKGFKSGNVSPSQQHQVQEQLAQISELHNVHVVPEGQLAQSLDSLGFIPRLQLGGSADVWYGRWREDEDEAVVFLYYDGTDLACGAPATNKIVTFATLGAPYTYDAWTGEQRPLDHYTQVNGSTMLTLSLAGSQTTMIAFRMKEARHSAAASQITLANGSDNTQPITLSKWNLSMETWSAPNNISDIQGTVKHNTTYAIDELLPWSQLAVSNKLTLVAGRGYYCTSFFWSRADGLGKTALLTMSPILRTAVLRVNGHTAPPLDVTAPRSDISAYLVEGENIIDIIVSTPLGNALIPVADKLRPAGADLSLVQASLGINPIQPREYGLVGEVTIHPY
ncbi:putative Galactose-binding-like domain superfamily [Septoria linicola]|nr:putative Galactose-binding-like domain superfamily [Septoria linicola]